MYKCCVFAFVSTLLYWLSSDAFIICEFIGIWNKCCLRFHSCIFANIWMICHHLVDICFCSVVLTRFSICCYKYFVLVKNLGKQCYEMHLIRLCKSTSMCIARKTNNKCVDTVDIWSKLCRKLNSLNQFLLPKLITLTTFFEVIHGDA